MNYILVTGGAGYIGSHTVKHLLNNNYNVLVLDNLSCGFKQAVDSRAKFIHADLMDRFSLGRIFQNYKITTVIHFAAYIEVGESVYAPHKYYLNNVTGTLNLLDTMLAYDVKNIVFSSTCAIYGEPSYIPIDEHHPKNPISPYGKTKLMVERLLADYHKAYGLKYIALRYFNVAGASTDGSIGESHNPESHLIPLVLRAIKNQTPIKIFGTKYDTRDGTCVRDYIHVEDLAWAHHLAMEQLNNYNGGINLGTGTGTTIKEIIKAAESVTKQTCLLEYHANREGDPAQLLASNKIALQVLSWKPQLSSIENILRTAWFWEKNKTY